MTTITTIDALETLYGATGETSTVKEIDYISADYARLIEASPFVALATSGPEGLDCSPRGDKGPVVRIHDARTLLLPDRRGNNRIDSLRNIVRDPRVALLFLIPGSGTTLRVNGRATLSAAPKLLESFAVDGNPPRSVAIIAVETIYFQCARAIVRSSLWGREHHAASAGLPTPGDILAGLSGGRVGGQAYDAEWPARAAASLW